MGSCKEIYVDEKSGKMLSEANKESSEGNPELAKK